MIFQKKKLRKRVLKVPIFFLDQIRNLTMRIKIVFLKRFRKPVLNNIVFNKMKVYQHQCIYQNYVLNFAFFYFIKKLTYIINKMYTRKPFQIFFFFVLISICF